MQSLEVHDGVVVPYKGIRNSTPDKRTTAFMYFFPSESAEIPSPIAIDIPVSLVQFCKLFVQLKNTKLCATTCIAD